jgi:signal transduction histidine kinase
MSTKRNQGLRSVRVRTTAVAMVTVVLVLTVGALVLVRAFERQQLRQVDQRLARTSRLIEGTKGATPSMPAGAAEEAFVQVIDAGGDVVFATDQLRDRPALRSPEATGPAGSVTARVDGVGSLRVVAVPFGDRWVLFGESLRGVEDAVATLTTALLVGVPVLAALLGLLVWIVVGLTLRPAEEAMDRERRLVADVSHELRTPLAGARALLESESRIPAEIELNRLEALAVLTRLESMANDLLVEARSGEVDAVRLDTLVDLDDIVLRVVDLVPCPAGTTVDTSALSGGQVRGSDQDLERMVANLVTNALRHATGVVRIALDETGGMVTLAVSDDGPGIAPEDRSRVFERFTRLDDARSHEGTGAGLGLPIVRSVAGAHGGTVVASDGPEGRGIAFVVSLPAAAPVAAAGQPATEPQRGHLPDRTDAVVRT